MYLIDLITPSGTVEELPTPEMAEQEPDLMKSNMLLAAILPPLKRVELSLL